MKIQITHSITHFDAKFDGDFKSSAWESQIGLVLEIFLIYHLAVKTAPI